MFLGLGGLALLLSGSVGWGVFGTVAGAVIVPGRIEVETRDQVVEHLHGGTVREILVRDGDSVAAGDVLLRLDDTQLRANEAQLLAQHTELAARRNRLEAELRGADDITWEPDLLRREQLDSTVSDVLHGQQRLFSARRAVRSGRVAELRQRIGQTRKQLAGLAQLSAALKSQLDLIAREISARRSLFEKGLTQLHILLGLEREGARLRGQAGEVTAQTAQLNLAIAEIEVQILQVDAQHLEDAEAQARETHAEEIQVLERIAAIQDRLRSMDVRAPVAGEVFALAVFAPDEVVSPGEPILYVVPDDTGLLVVAKLDPSGVDQVFAGQDAVLRFTAFPARATPYFDGRVRWVSPDVLSDPGTGLEWYGVEIEISGDHPSADFPLEPGMPVEAHIRTSDRSPISYLMKPLTDHFARSMREQ